MEHVLLPQGVSLTDADAVPYLSSCEYDCGSFVTYPQRAALISVRKCVGAAEWELVFDWDKPGALETLNEELQRWLLFGLLHEFLGADFEESIFIHEKTTATGQSKFVSTADLHELLTKSASTTKAHTSDYVAERLVDMTKSLRVVRQLLKNDLAQYLQKNVWLSIACTADSLALFLFVVFDQQNIWRNDGKDVNIRDNNMTRFLDIEGMLRRGWCRYSISVLEKIVATCQTQFFASKLTRPNTRIKHDDCVWTACSAADDQARSMKGPAHRDPLCDCEPFAVDKSRLTKMVLDGKTPLVSACTSATIDLEAWDGQAPYIAISHVWSQGLGNPRGNALYKCQIDRLNGMLETFARVYKSESLTCESFWLDTLCCPAESGEARTQAIGRMRQTYEQAKYVLVLDDEMLQVSYYDTPWPDFLCIFLTTRWMSRLWTLQEAILAQNLLIIFTDTIISFDDIVRRLKPHQRDLRRGHMHLELVSRSMGLLRNLAKDPRVSEGLVEKTRLNRLGMTMVLRRTSKEEDEAICAGSILALDVERIARERDHVSRMREMWTQIASAHVSWGLASSVIFHCAPSLSETSFTWAPRTLLIGNSVDLLLGATNTQRARLTSEGLCVHLPALLLDVFHCAVPDESGKWRETTVDTICTNENKHFVQLGGGNWLFLESWYSPQKTDELWPGGFFNLKVGDKIALVLFKDVDEMRSSVSLSSSAVLARIDRREDYCFSVTKLRPVICRLANAGETTFLQRTFSMIRKCYRDIVAMIDDPEKRLMSIVEATQQSEFHQKIAVALSLNFEDPKISRGIACIVQSMMASSLGVTDWIPRSKGATWIFK